MRKLVLTNFPGHFWESKIVGQLRKGDKFCLIIWSKPELSGPDFGHIKKGHVLVLHNCKSKIWLCRYTVFLQDRVHNILPSSWLHMWFKNIPHWRLCSWRGGGVEMGAWSWLGWESEIVNIYSQAKKQQLRSSKLSKNTLNAQLDTHAKDLPFSGWVFSMTLNMELS